MENPQCKWQSKILALATAKSFSSFIPHEWNWTWGAMLSTEIIIANEGSSTIMALLNAACSLAFTLGYQGSTKA